MNKRDMLGRMDAFTRGYLDCAAWVGVEPVNEGEDRPEVCFSDFTVKALKSVVADCADFQTGNADALETAYEFERYDASNAGHDFFLTRNGHGCGFWDRGLDRIGEVLSAACRPYGSADFYLHRGKVHAQ